MTVNKKNILIITWTRAEYGLLKPLILWLKKNEKYNVELLVTGIHLLKKYWSTIDIIKKDNIDIDYIVNISENWDMLSWLAEEINWINEVLKNNKIDLIFVLGDRDEPLAASIWAAHFKIPVAHIHWWDVTWHLPDEYIRSAITKFSHLHFTASENSYNRVLNMWENEKNIFNVWAIWLDWINKEELFSKKELANFLWLDNNKKWILLLQHPTISDVSYENQINNSLLALENIDAEKIIIYPNSDEWTWIYIKNIEKYEEKNQFSLFKNIDRQYYLSLLNTIDIMVWNSSSGVIESWFFWLNTLNIWDRQKWREKGLNVIDIGYSKTAIYKNINKLLNFEKVNIINSDNPYYKWWAVKKIIDILDSINDFSNLFSEK